MPEQKRMVPIFVVAEQGLVPYIAPNSLEAVRASALAQINTYAGAKRKEIAGTAVLAEMRRKAESAHAELMKSVA
ncbi:hypothetical protein [Pandoraea sp. CB10b_02]|uniref:hypothetical protein n=1 Tax=Pandoraea sp. CB10b_02 TaxID=2014535 RepID=UPI00257CDDD5|nr:hypothetical protein [Pandoraea sp. CB10b_02]